MSPTCFREAKGIRGREGEALNGYCGGRRPYLMGLARPRIALVVSPLIGVLLLFASGSRVSRSVPHASTDLATIVNETPGTSLVNDPMSVVGGAGVGETALTLNGGQSICNKASIIAIAQAAMREQGLNPGRIIPLGCGHGVVTGYYFG